MYILPKVLKFTWEISGKVLKGPLTHFLLAGAVMFGVSVLLAGGGANMGPAEDTRITVTKQEIQRLSTLWARRWRRAPSEPELRGLIASHIQQEVFYRQARALGLGRDDTIVRRRLVQKLELFISYSAVNDQPSQMALRAYFAKHRDRYRLPGSLSFTHIYFNPDKRGKEVRSSAKTVLVALTKTKLPPLRAPDKGDRFMLRYDYARMSHRDIARQFGRIFADAVFKVLTSDWVGPIESGYGLHLVRVHDRTPGRRARFEEVKQAVLRDFVGEFRRKAKTAAYKKMRGRYRIVIETDAGPQPWKAMD